jgi:hypothetical protein
LKQVSLSGIDKNRKYQIIITNAPLEARRKAQRQAEVAVHGTTAPPVTRGGEREEVVESDCHSFRRKHRAERIVKDDIATKDISDWQSTDKSSEL